jgi:hypothetical protein
MSWLHPVANIHEETSNERNPSQLLRLFTITQVNDFLIMECGHIHGLEKVEYYRSSIGLRWSFVIVEQSRPDV